MAKGRLTERGAKRLGERERTAGLDPDDEAARWLAEHDPPPEPAPSKSAFKSKELHRWRQAQKRSEAPPGAPSERAPSSSTPCR